MSKVYGPGNGRSSNQASSVFKFEYSNFRRKTHQVEISLGRHQFISVWKSQRSKQNALKFSVSDPNVGACRNVILFEVFGWVCMWKMYEVRYRAITNQIIIRVDEWHGASHVAIIHCTWQLHARCITARKINGRAMTETCWEGESRYRKNGETARDGGRLERRWPTTAGDRPRPWLLYAAATTLLEFIASNECLTIVLCTTNELAAAMSCPTLQGATKQSQQNKNSLINLFDHSH